MELLDTMAKVILELMGRLNTHLRDHEDGVDHYHGSVAPNDILNPAYHTHSEYAENYHSHTRDYAEKYHRH